MLNGTDAQTFGKQQDADHLTNSQQHHHQRTTSTSSSKDLITSADFKMGIQDARFYYSSDSVHHQSGQDALALSSTYHHHTEQQTAIGGFGAPHHHHHQAGRFYSPQSLGSSSTGGCPFGGGVVRSPARSGAAGGQGYEAGKEVYHHPASSPESYPFHHQHHHHHHHGYPRPLYPLPGLQVCGKTQTLLNNYPLWAKFHKYQTEMIITKQGRRMFPFLSFNISVLDPSAHYNVYVDVVLADQHHWRYQGGKWVQCGKAEANMPGNRMYMHPDSPNTGAHWMRQEVSFGKLKLTNNKGSSNNVAQMIVLQSLHKYQPRLHIVEVKEDGTEEPYLSAKAQTFIFPETQFIAVTAYQNADITQLKIDHNPFAKGFRDNYDTLYAAAPESDRLTPSPTESQQLLPGTCYSQSYLSEQYMSPLPQGRFYGREPGAGAMAQPSKDPSSSPPGGPHSRWYLSAAAAQQGVAPGRFDFSSSYEGDFSAANGFYKPFPLQTSAHHHHHHHALGYYSSDHPFAASAGGGASSAGWASGGRPSPQYLSHPGKHGSGSSSSLGWYRPVSSSTSTSSSPSSMSPSAGHRLHHVSLLESLRPAPPPLPQDKAKEGGEEDPWLQPPSVKSVDSADSGLFEGGGGGGTAAGENKKRRVSPYASSTENSPTARGGTGEVCGEKDSGSDTGYYGFYTH